MTQRRCCGSTRRHAGSMRFMQLSAAASTWRAKTAASLCCALAAGREAALLSADEPCAQLETCSACVERPWCSWCSTTQSCHGGGKHKASGELCLEWHELACPKLPLDDRLQRVETMGKKALVRNVVEDMRQNQRYENWRKRRRAEGHDDDAATSAAADDHDDDAAVARRANSAVHAPGDSQRQQCGRRPRLSSRSERAHL